MVDVVCGVWFTDTGPEKVRIRLGHIPSPEWLVLAAWMLDSERSDAYPALAALLGLPLLPLDTSRGEHFPHRIAVIDENTCIGCAKCLAPCPTDAIVGAGKFMHTVVAALCTGCELCIPPCPVDCIRMEEDANFPVMMNADDARSRFHFHQLRLARDKDERNIALAESERIALAKNGQH